MENSGDSSIDLAKLENNLRNKLIELQLKTRSLEETQRELVEARQNLYDKDIKIEEDRREFSLIKIQLDVATSAMRKWDEEKTVQRCEQVQTAMHSKIITMERDSLLNQTTNLQLENMILKQRIKELENINAGSKPDEETLDDLKKNVSVVMNTANSELSKLHHDFEALEKSVKAANKLNGRLQAAGMCAHGIQSKYKMRIEELEDKLNSINLNNEKS